MATFLYVSLVLFIIWLAFFLFSPSSRREQVLMSFIGLLLSPAIMLLTFGSRSNLSSVPPIGIEDALFAFSLFGVASVIYQVIFAKHLEFLRDGRSKKVPSYFRWTASLIFTICAWLFLATAITVLFSVPALQATIASGLMVGIYIIADRKDLLADALLSGFFIAILIFIIEQLFFLRLFPEAAQALWQTNQVKGILLSGIPLEEMLWISVVGFTIGPLYEYVRRMRLV